MEDITKCFVCSWNKRVNQQLCDYELRVNLFDPRYSDDLCVDCVILVDEEFDPTRVKRDEYLNKLFEERMAERSEPFAIWSQNPPLLKWYPMNDNATHWRCCSHKKNCIIFQDFYINVATTPPPIKRQETDIIFNKKNELNWFYIIM